MHLPLRNGCWSMVRLELCPPIGFLVFIVRSLGSSLLPPLLSTTFPKARGKCEDALKNPIFPLSAVLQPRYSP
ncbi:hypothetical protein BDV11DRAFT_197109 [Aspergillus similis]